MNLPDFSNPVIFLAITIIIFLVVAGRYAFIAGIFQLVFFVWGKNKWQKRRLGKKPVDKTQLRKEIKWSLITSGIFAVSGAVAFLLWQKGYTKLYFELDEYGLWYLPASLVISMFIHETYYYWIHRWMHKPGIFKLVHKVHHDSHTTSPWTAFSFHPLEGLLQAIVLPLIIIAIPLNIYVLLVQLTLMTFSSVINHLELEVYPANFQRHFIGKWLIGATHHSLHHKQFKYNFGLYFTFWDKFKKTESPKFFSLFDEKTSVESNSK